LIASDNPVVFQFVPVTATRLLLMAKLA